jgi:hypothetical protein
MDTTETDGLFPQEVPPLRAWPPLSCSEAYEQFSANAFRSRLEDAIEKGEWLESHFHGIDDTHLYISTPVFRELLEYTRSQASKVWQAGMAAIHKYQVARDQSSVIVEVIGPNDLAVHLTCATDPVYYDQELTIELDMLGSTDSVEVLDSHGNQLGVSADTKKGNQVIHFNVSPENDVYRLKSENIGRLYEESNGPELPDPGPHPYLFLKKEDVPALRNKARAPVAAEMWQQIESEGKRLLESGPDEHESTPDWEQARDSSNRIRVLGFLGVFTGNSSYADRAKPEIETILAADRWIILCTRVTQIW